MKRIIKFLSDPAVMFYATMWMMVLVVAGTVAQKFDGLYVSQHTYFSAWILWLGGFLPLPSGIPTMGLVFLGLFAKLLFGSPWNRKNAGVIITHIGAVLLLSGGLITALHAEEGSMVIKEGDSAAYVEDYHTRELAIYDLGADKKVSSTPLQQLEVGQKIDVKGTPISVEIVKVCRNCEFFARKNISPEFKGRAAEVDISTKKEEKIDEQNRSAVQFRVTGVSKKADGIYFSVDFMDAAPQFEFEGKSYKVVLQKQRTPLPFTVRLLKFERQYYPGTAIARSYKSDVILKDGKTEWRSTIQMNEPLRYKGYTFYQSSFIDDGQDKPATVLAVVKNAGRLFPYISSIVMCVGLLLHMGMKLPKLIKSRLAVAVVSLVCGFATPAQASVQDFDFGAFSAIPIQDQGRVKPINSFAKNYLELFSGQSSGAVQWLAELIFNPDKAYQQQVFKISDALLTDTLGLERREGHYYSYQEVAEGLSKSRDSWKDILTLPPEQLNAQQKKLVQLVNKAEMYADISRSLSLVSPEFKIASKSVARSLGVKSNVWLSYGDMMAHHKDIAVMGKQALKKYMKSPKSMTADDAEMLSVVQRMAAIENDRNSVMLRVIPPQWESDKLNKEWFSVWSITQAGQGSPAAAELSVAWKDMVAAYRAGDAAQWKKTSGFALEKSMAMAGTGASPLKIKLEALYVDWSPLQFALAFYLLAFLLILASLTMKHGFLYGAASGAFVTAFGFNGVALLLRMIIMGRPPVTNLFASILFVCFIVGLISLVYEWKMRNRMGLIIASAAGTLLQFIAIRFEADGDTMGMLVAVLDTNFWLGTHVVTITVGYGCCLVGSVLAHLYLAFRILRPQDEKRAEELARNIRGISYVALFFCSLGTILGGIWADQSWGRFWGWDPKENGAMLIVLWLLCLTHGRLAKILDEISFAAGMVLLNATVAIAWFGVNLLGVGLHSYGFTDSAVIGLAVFCGGELTYAVAGLLFVRKRLARCKGGA